MDERLQKAKRDAKLSLLEAKKARHLEARYEGKKKCLNCENYVGLDWDYCGRCLANYVMQYLGWIR